MADCDCLRRAPPRRGALLNRVTENITISDAVHLLMFLAKMNASILMDSGAPARGTLAWEAAFVSPTSQTAYLNNPDTATPQISDAVHILMYLAKMNGSAIKRRD